MTVRAKAKKTEEQVEPARRLAAIDVGTNSVHMIVVEREGRGYRVLDREKEMVQLGSGAGRDGTLSSEAIDRTVEALVRMAAIARSLSVDEILTFATSATRDARNARELISRVREEAKLAIQVISGEEEADLIYRAVCSTVDFESQTALIVDIGGGSVEVISGTAEELFFASSVPIGALRLTEKFLSKDPPGTKDLARCRRYIRKKLNRSIDSAAAIGFDFVIGTSGTIETLAKMASTESGDVAAPLEWMERSALDERIEEMSRMTAAERAEHWKLDPKRASVILAGALILEHVMHELRVRRMRACSSAMREGMIARFLYDREDSPDLGVRRSAVMNLAERSRVDLDHAEHVARLALAIFDQSGQLHRLGEPEREILEYAALLHDAGLRVSYRAHHKHAYYLIRHSGLDGFTQRQILMIANVARYHRKAKPSSKHDNFIELTVEEQDVVRKLAAILRLAEGLDRGRRGAVDRVGIEHSKRSVIIRISSRIPPTVELDSARKSAKYFRKLFDRKVRFEIQPFRERV